MFYFYLKRIILFQYFLSISENDERLPDIPPNGTEWEIIIGEGDTYFDRIVGRLLQTMLKLEVSEFRIKFGNAFCLLRIQLVDFFPPPIHIYHMSEEQKLSEAERLKLRASDLIKENRFVGIYFLLL